jgi:SEC-C motif
VPTPGRNQPCPCGSGHKAKHCCGQQRGPSDEQLARAHLATLAHAAVHDLAGLSDDALEILWEDLFDLPTIDLSLHVKLPELITPELHRLRDAVADDDPDRGWEELRAVTDQIDTPHQRARLADAILQLRAQHRLTRTQAAYAIYHLNTPSQHLLAASLTHTIAVAAGASRTPGGLRIAA